MTNLRLFGIILGILIFCMSFILYRGPKWKRSSFLLFSLFSFGLIILGIDPNFVNFLRDLFALGENQSGRLIALLIVSNIFLFFFVFYSYSKIGYIKIQFDGLIRATVNAQSQKEEILKRIKPIIVVIPAYNESENLRELIPKIPDKVAGIDLGILVIDDGSEDETSMTASRFENTITITSPINRGGGAALRIGYDILLKYGTQICVTMDADGQHRPEDIEKLVTPVIHNRCDLAIGSRIMGSRDKDSMTRFAGIYVFRFIINFLLGTKITDPSSGFRAFPVHLLQDIKLYEDQYHTTELIIEARKKNLKIVEVPITILKRKHGKTKKGKNIIYGLNFARVIIKTWWRRKE